MRQNSLTMTMVEEGHETTKTPETAETVELVSQTSREKTLARIASIKLGLDCEMRDNSSTSLVEIFITLCNRYIGLSGRDVKMLTDPEIIELGKIIFEKANKTRNKYFFICTLIPLINLVFWGAVFIGRREHYCRDDYLAPSSERYIYLYKYLGLDLNPELFPIGKIRNKKN